MSSSYIQPERVKCPHCGGEEGYYTKCKVRYNLYFTADGEPDGKGEEYELSTSAKRRMHCRCCDGQLGFAEMGDIG